MAERVEIRGGELDGSVLENAASEATLLRLVESLERMSRGGGPAGQRSEADPAAAARLQNLYNESKKRGTTATDKLSSATKSAATAVSDFASGIAGAIKSIFGAIDKVGSASINLAFSGATPTVTAFTDALATFLPMGQTIKALGTTVETAINDFREISTVGADLGTGLLAIKKRAIEANLPLEVFKKAITENAQGLATISGSVSKGAMQFAQISGAVQKLRPQFASLGMTVEETGMFIASYLTQQQHLGQLQNMSVRQQTQGAIEYNLELDKMARATGIQRKALDEANRQAMLDTKSRLALMNLEGPARSRFTARMTQLTSTGAGEIADVIKNLVATQGLVMPGMEKVVLAFRDAGVDITKITREISAGNANAIVELEQGIMKAGSIGKNLEGADRSLAGLGLVTGKTVPQQFLAMLAPLANGMGNVETAANDQKTAINDATKNLANFDGVILEARNKLSEALMPALDQMMNTAGSFVNLMGPDGPFLKAISSAATNVSDYINKFIEDAQSTDIIQAFQNLWNKLYSDSLPYVEKYWNELLAYSKAVILPKLSDLGDSLKKGIYDLFTNPTVVSALIGGIGLLLGGSLIKSAILGIPGSILDAGKSAKDAYKGAANPPGGGPVAPGAANRAAIGAGTTGLIKNLGKQALKFIPGVGLVMGAEEIGSTLLDSNLTSDQKTVNVAGTAGGMAGATAMGATGAALGTLAGPIGTVVGGLLGSIFGYFGGSYAGKSLAEKSVTGISNQKPTPPAAETPATKSAVESKPAMLEKTSAITDTNTQLAELNTTMTRVAVLLEDNNKLLRNVKTNTRATSGNLA